MVGDSIMNARSNYININKPYAVSLFSQRFGKILFENLYDSYSEIIILCVGTDRSTGDCLGPLIGQRLKYIQNKKIRVYGTLDDPVHAKNLKEVLEGIEKNYGNPFIISIDACLGKTDSIGCISVGKGPIKPGAGVNKKLPETGNIHIMGIVNVGGFMEYIILQNTRLSLVMRMADIISAGIYHNLSKYINNRLMQDRTIKK